MFKRVKGERWCLKITKFERILSITPLTSFIIFNTRYKTNNRRFRSSQRHLAWGCKLWSILYKIPWSSLRCWTIAVKKLQGFDYVTGSQISFPNFIFWRKFLHLWAAWRSGNEKNSTRIVYIGVSTPPLFFDKPSPTKSASCPTIPPPFQAIPSLYSFRAAPPPLEIGFVNEPHIEIFILTPSHLLKSNKILS